jgi:hypothetical protein
MQQRVSESDAVVISYSPGQILQVGKYFSSQLAGISLPLDKEFFLIETMLPVHGKELPYVQ